MKVENQIKIAVKNNSKTKKKVVLLNGFCTSNKKDYGFPDGIDVKVWIIGGRGEITYKQLLEYSLCIPMEMKFSSTTNNRQVDIGFVGFYGDYLAAEPSLTIDGKPRPKEEIECSDEYSTWTETKYVKEWNPKKWNIADTGEWFVCKGDEKIDITLKSNQEFEIILDVAENRGFLNSKTKLTKKYF